MLKTMRNTVPENPFSKNSPMSTGAGKETFTDIFDMEIARKMNRGDSLSISELLHKSLKKLVKSEYKGAETKNVEIKAVRPDKRTPIKPKLMPPRRSKSSKHRFTLKQIDTDRLN